MLIELNNEETHQVLQCLNNTAMCTRTRDDEAYLCECIWRKIFDASQEAVEVSLKPKAKDECSESISRLEIIGATAGRLLTRWNIEIEQISIQDEGRTMKIFIRNKEL